MLRECWCQGLAQRLGLACFSRWAQCCTGVLQAKAHPDFKKWSSQYYVQSKAVSVPRAGQEWEDWG